MVRSYQQAPVSGKEIWLARSEGVFLALLFLFSRQTCEISLVDLWNLRSAVSAFWKGKESQDVKFSWQDVILGVQVGQGQGQGLSELIQVTAVNKKLLIRPPGSHPPCAACVETKAFNICKTSDV